MEEQVKDVSRHSRRNGNSMGGTSLKTIVRLKKDMAAIVFSSQGCQLVYPEGTNTDLQHVSLAAALTLAIQYEVFVQSMFAFLKDVTKEKEVTH